MIRHSRSGKAGSETALKDVLGKMFLEMFLEGAQDRDDGRPIAQAWTLM
jgi:hypothetical protein